MKNKEDAIIIPEFESAIIGVGERIVGPPIIVYNKAEVIDILSADYDENAVYDLYRMMLDQFKGYDPDYLPIFLTENWRL